MGVQEQLLAVTALDGRDAKAVADLRPIVSEFGLIKYRVAVEAGWLSLLASGELPDVPAVSDKAQHKLNEIAHNFAAEDVLRVKEIEATTNHDVKAVELALREKLKQIPEWRELLELTHFGLTSEDVTNLAYAMMLREARDSVLLPNMEEIAVNFDNKALEFADIPMLAHTHGQPASPTTLGKEMDVFAQRIYNSADQLGSVAITGKVNGASGNYNALSFAYPEVDWPALSRKFVESLGFDFNVSTTQIEPHDWMVRYFNEVALANNIMTDAAQDMWLYIMLKYFSLKAEADEVGSSTMPHKVNPINFEKAESNFTSANAVLNGLANKLPKSRLQRDLSDSSSQRTTGQAFGHTVIAQKELLKGLKKVVPNEVKIQQDLSDNWAVLTEAVQTVMRRYGIKGAYDAIKAASRGKDLTENDYFVLVNSIDGLPEEARQRLLDLTPATYIGRASEIARGEI